MDTSKMTPIQLGLLRSCDSCGSSLVRPHECHCDACLIAHCQTLIHSYDADQGLDAEFKAKMLKRYHVRLEHLQGR